MEISLVQLTLAQASEQFPGCITEDIQEVHSWNQQEEGYHKLGILDGRLLSMCYEISFLSWSVWDDGDWRDLADVDGDLFNRLEEAERITWR